MRTFLTLVLAVVMAVAAALFANNWLEQQRQATVQEVVTVRTKPVVVAAVDIPFGSTLAENHLKVISVSEDSFEEGTFKSVEEVKGKIVKQALYEGEVIRAERVASRGDTGGSPLAAIVPANKRAISVRVNDVIGVAGFLLPGDYVDVLASRRSGSNREAVTRTVLEKIKVLAVDQTASPDKDQPVIVRAVTLEVDPREAEILVEATQEGAVQLALRNPLDETVMPPPEPEKPVEPPKVVEAAPPPPPPPPKIIYRDRPAPQITVIRGDGEGVSVHTSPVAK